MEELFISVVIGLVTTYVIVGATIVLAAIIAIGAVFLFRSGKKKNVNAAATGGSDWQRQAQPGTPGTWNQGQGDAWGQQAGGWGQQAQGQQQQGNWGQQAQGNQQQQGGWGMQNGTSQAGGWGAPAQQQSASSWEAQQNQQQIGTQNGWGGGTPNPNQQPAWGNQNATSAPANPWNNPAASAQPANAWGNQSAPTAWDQNPAPMAAQDPWGQQQAAPAQQGGNWGMAANSVPQAQSPTSLGGNTSSPSWNQTVAGGQPPADAWGTPAAQQYQGMGGAAMGAMSGIPSTPANNAPVAPSWQQQQGNNFGQGGGWQQQQGGMNANAPFGNNDGDQTMLRPMGQQGMPGTQGGTGLGVVRVEEGKEPGRVYEIRKEALSIGRSRESDIFLEDLAVSRLHASIVNLGNGNYGLKDEGSANGTKVNGQLVSKYQTWPLQEGDKVQLGQTVLVFSRH